MVSQDCNDDGFFGFGFDREMKITAMKFLQKIDAQIGLGIAWGMEMEILKTAWFWHQNDK